VRIVRIALAALMQMPAVGIGLLPVQALAEPAQIPVKLEAHYAESIFEDENTIPLDLNEAMNLPLRFTWGPPKIAIFADGKESEVNVTTCAEAERYFPSVRKVLSEGFDMFSYRTTIGDCETVKRIVKLKPSKISYVSLFVPEIIKKLATATLPAEPPEFKAFFRQFKSAQLPICGAQSECHVYTEKEPFDLDTIALGDYDGDGYQDLILKISRWPQNSTTDRSIGVVLTRKATHGELTVLEWWRTN
jgi:hypothetical protein